ncbi:MAG: hypothetical protein KF819_35690 [Labilithrix sp.]|nr:hypothetical protein [Labilithrix sp.]
MAATTLELDDIQGIILRGYAAMQAAAFVLLEVTDPAKAKAWLAALPLTTAAVEPREAAACTNVAFTAAGLMRLGLPRETLEGFSRELQDGMVTRHRKRLLGDGDTSAPAHWWWGRAPADAASSEDDVPDPRLHVMLLLYARTDGELAERVADHRAEQAASGLAELGLLSTQLLADRKEHFGFRDGVSQPEVRGFHDRRPGSHANTINAGEILLGYPNEYGKLPAGPAFGRNGSYLVARTLRQDVGAFWSFVAAEAERLGVQPEWLASRMVGRWPSGAPVIGYADADPGRNAADENDFGFASEDRLGHVCPIGSHIRRTNPRDDMIDFGKEEAIKLVNRHRIVRRGRAFGRPVDPTMTPRELLRSDDVDDERSGRGLHFLCFCADISRQFEFTQNTWMNNPKGLGLYDDPDPIAGPGGGCFTMQADPVRKRVTGVPRFVHVRGGAYLFMPGIAATRELARP